MADRRFCFVERFDSRRFPTAHAVRQTAMLAVIQPGRASESTSGLSQLKNIRTAVRRIVILMAKSAAAGCESRKWGYFTPISVNSPKREIMDKAWQPGSFCQNLRPQIPLTYVTGEVAHDPPALAVHQICGAPRREGVVRDSLFLELQPVSVRGRWRRTDHRGL